MFSIKTTACWKLMLASVLCCLLPTHVLYAAPKKTERQHITFEKKALQGWFLVGFGRAETKDRTAKLSQSTRAAKVGKKGLLFSYKRGVKKAPAVLYHQLLLRDFQSLRFWIKAKRKTTWTISLTDLDGAVFFALLKLPAKRWKKIHLRPRDFRCSKDSPVQKKKLDPRRLTTGYKGFDQALLSGRKSNAIAIDQLEITRPAVIVINGDLLLNQQTKVFDRPTRIKGNLMLVRDAKLELRSTRLEVEGNIVITRSQLKAYNSAIQFLQKPWQRRRLAILPAGYVSLDQSTISAKEGFDIIAHSTATLRLKKSQLRTKGARVLIHKNATCVLRRSSHIDQLVIRQGARVRLIDSHHIGISLALGKGTIADLSLPTKQVKRVWLAPTPLKMDLFIQRCKALDWSIRLQPGAKLTLRHSKLKEITLAFRTKQAKLSSLGRTKSYEDFTLKTDNHTLRLFKSKLRHWSCEAYGQTALTLHRATLRSLKTFNQASVQLTQSKLRGERANVQVWGQSELIMKKSHLRGKLHARQSGIGWSKQSTIDGDILVSERARVLLTSSTHKGKKLRYFSASIRQK
ncbi:MAG: hypothetical protein CL920_11820 [Deltaproteobacteria bacterium]|nr:hypothetical protein [Deltaproteobacteria bacterium]